MGFYRKKPVVIEAIQWTGFNLQEITDFVGKDLSYDANDTDRKAPADVSLTIHTLEGDHKAIVSDYIIKGVNGEYYPCKEKIFLKTYEEANDR